MIREMSRHEIEQEAFLAEDNSQYLELLEELDRMTEEGVTLQIGSEIALMVRADWDLMQLPPIH